MLTEFLETPFGQIVISVILGLGLATVFQKVCKGQNCIVVDSPDMKDINKYVYKIEDDCYKYKPYATVCDASKST